MMPDNDYPHPLGLHVTENRERDRLNSMNNSKRKGGGKTRRENSLHRLVSRLEETVKYYERMHRDARTALDIAGRNSLEMKEQLISARQKLERAKSANDKLRHSAPAETEGMKP